MYLAVIWWVWNVSLRYLPHTQILTGVASDKAGFFTYFLEKTPSSFAYYNFFSPTEDKGGNRYVKVQEILHMICENGAGLY